MNWIIFINKNTNPKAFTLAETLITLGIIGIVATLTIPTLVENYQKEQAVSQLKKTFTELAQLVKQSELDNGNNSQWDWGSDYSTAQVSFDKYWAPYLKIAQRCTSYSNCGYTSSNPWKLITGVTYTVPISSSSSSSVGSSVILADGTFIMVRTLENTTSRKDLFVDINGNKGPNIFSKDLFSFVLDPNKGLMPQCYNWLTSSANTNCISGDTKCCPTKIINDGWKIASDYPW